MWQPPARPATRARPPARPPGHLARITANQHQLHRGLWARAGGGRCRAQSDAGLLAQDCGFCRPPAPGPVPAGPAVCAPPHGSEDWSLMGCWGQGSRPRGGSPLCDLQVPAVPPPHSRGLRAGARHRGGPAQSGGFKAPKPWSLASYRGWRGALARSPAGAVPFLQVGFFPCNLKPALVDSRK